MKVRCLLVLFPGSNRDKRYWTFVQHRAANLCMPADLLAGTGVIFSCDLSETKVHLIQENMERAGVDHCELYRQNARILRKDSIDSVDVLIADLPCSGLGVIGGKCDIKYHTHREDIDELASLEREICGLSANMYGRVVYCYIVRVPLQEKKTMITFHGSRRHFRFVPVSIEEDLPESLRGKTGKEGYLQVLPGNGSDGFFVAKFQRKGI